MLELRAVLSLLLIVYALLAQHQRFNANVFVRADAQGNPMHMSLSMAPFVEVAYTCMLVYQVGCAHQAPSIKHPQQVYSMTLTVLQGGKAYCTISCVTLSLHSSHE